MNLPVKSMHIMVLTGEPSGDFHAGRLVLEIRRRCFSISFSGMGGPHLRAAGVDLFYDIEHLSVMGVTEVLMQIGHIKNAFDRFREKLRSRTPDLIILVDYPGFNLKAAEYAKKRYPSRVLYYITPKIWAWKRSRLFKIKKYVDYAALILPFEEAMYRKAGVPARYVGNPLIDEYPELPQSTSVSGPPFSHGPVVGLLPGSRKTEVRKLLDIMIESSLLIHQTYPEVRFLVSRAESIPDHMIQNRLKRSGHSGLFTMVKGPVQTILQQSHLVIAASGTVTLEAALFQVPTLLIYRMAFVSFMAARLLVHVKYAGLANLIVNEEVMPELLQSEASPQKIGERAVFMLENASLYRDRLKAVRKKLGRGGAAGNTAGIAISLLSDQNP